MDRNTLDVGSKAPGFVLPSSLGGMYSLYEQLEGLQKPLVLYFYPKDLTSGCTQEACDFQNSLQTHSAFEVVGISRDNLDSHNKFSEKHHLKFPLLFDETGEVCQKYGVWVEKSMYGRKYFGIERTTFLLDPEGRILKVWRKVAVKNHVNEILNTL